VASRRVNMKSDKGDQSGLLIDWEDAEFRGGIVPGSGILTAKGVLRQPAEVRLVDQPGSGAYWEIQVRAFEPEVGPEVETPYSVSRTVSGRMGKDGFDLVGATKRLRVHVKPFPTGEKT
jgi:hypothetical protein